jgi:hypothetical protein
MRKSGQTQSAPESQLANKLQKNAVESLIPDKRTRRNPSKWGVKNPAGDGFCFPTDSPAKAGKAQNKPQSGIQLKRAKKSRVSAKKRAPFRGQWARFPTRNMDAAKILS